MFLPPRQSQIVERARRKGRVLVEELAAEFSVSPQTVRKDLNELCENGVLTRIHGGAVMPASTHNVQYEQRRRIAAG